MDNNPNRPIPQNQGLQSLSAKEFSSKYNSKREVYNFLAVDVGVYLPSYGK